MKVRLVVSIIVCAALVLSLQRGLVVAESLAQINGGTPADVTWFGCYSWATLEYQNKVVGGKGVVRVSCPEVVKVRNHVITITIKARDLKPDARWVVVKKETFRCKTGVPLPSPSCTVKLPFDASTTHARLYRVEAEYIIDGGLPRIPLYRGDMERVFNRHGVPYPYAEWYREPLEFPSYDGPWGPPTRRTNPVRFKELCDDRYYQEGWDYMLRYQPGENLEYHHIHPLAQGGVDDGFWNCYILPSSLHQEFTDWWRGFNP